MITQEDVKYIRDVYRRRCGIPNIRLDYDALTGDPALFFTIGYDEFKGVYMQEHSDKIILAGNETRDALIEYIRSCKRRLDEQARRMRE